MRIDAKVRAVRPDNWRGHQAKEQVIKRALYDVIADENEVESLFRIIKAQGEY
jgi:type I restriction enzyme R subunit